MSYLELLAAVFGFASVWLTIVRHVGAWPIGLVQVVLYIAVFWQAKLYADMLLHVVYVFLQGYGWWQWRKSSLTLSDAATPSIPVRRLTLSQQIGCCGLIAVMTWIFTWALQTWTDALSPLADSWIAAASLVAQVLLALRFVDTWRLWILIDTVAMVVFWQRELYATAVLYGVFWGMAWIGLREWRRVAT